MVKHESGYIITDPEGLAAFHAMYGDAERESKLPRQMMALVRKDKNITLKCDRDGTRFAPPPEGELFIWVVIKIGRDAGSPIYFDRSKPDTKETMRVMTVGQKHYSKCWFPREIIPLEFIKSPARLALESLGARLA